MTIENRDYTIIVDRSGSMATRDINGKSRWEAAREATQAIAEKCATVDPDGITLYTFAGNFKRHDNVQPGAVARAFAEHEPFGSTDLAGVLKDALGNWRTRKGDGSLKNGDTILVITDGEPDDRAAVAKVIVETSKVMDKDEELAIAFFQIGNDSGAKRFLDSLDNDLQGQGAKFDIVDAKTFEEVEKIGISAALLAAIED